MKKSLPKKSPPPSTACSMTHHTISQSNSTFVHPTLNLCDCQMTCAKLLAHPSPESTWWWLMLLRSAVHTRNFRTLDIQQGPVQVQSCLNQEPNLEIQKSTYSATNFCCACSVGRNHANLLKLLPVASPYTRKSSIYLHAIMLAVGFFLRDAR